jgi:predicted nucleic acid-binding protein
VIYVDTSVVLAHVLAEDRHPPASIWDEVLVASRLVEYETWVRVHATGFGDSHGAAIRATLGRIRFAALSQDVLDRALSPFPVPVRTLDALHLATLVYLQGMSDLRLATYDTRMAQAATALGIALEEL